MPVAAHTQYGEAKALKSLTVLQWKQCYRYLTFRLFFGEFILTFDWDFFLFRYLRCAASAANRKLILKILRRVSGAGWGILHVELSGGPHVARLRSSSFLGFPRCRAHGRASSRLCCQ